MINIYMVHTQLQGQRLEEGLAVTPRPLIRLQLSLGDKSLIRGQLVNLINVLRQLLLILSVFDHS